MNYMTINNSEMKKKDYVISAIRFLAMWSIILCHVAQYYDKAIAWWLNIGVQVFFCISGWLYGNVKIDNSLQWLWNNYLKISIDALIFLIITLPVYMCFDRGLSVLEIVEALLFYSFPSGYAHLWFLPYILFCYLLTPLLQAIWTEWEKLKRSQDVIILVIITLIGVQVIVPLFASYFKAPWISCFIVSYFLRKLRVAGNVCGGVFERCICLLGIGLSILRLVTELCPDMIVIPEHFYVLFVNYSKMFLGVTLFLLLQKVFRHIPLEKMYVVLDISDKYSYDVYIVHQFFILGSCSILSMPYFGALKGIVLIAIIAVVSVLLHWTSKKVRKLILIKMRFIQ